MRGPPPRETAFMPGDSPDPPFATVPGRRGVARHAPAFLAMLLGVVLVYLPAETFGGGQWRMLGIDSYLLHERRIDFALEQLRQHGTLPGWYPRELMGSPFWSNVQAFPFIPTRLATFWTGRENAFTLSVWLSAMTAAAFTYAWMVRVGAGRVGAAAAGWTFACGGFFAARVLAGHQPLLEAFAALPALLFAVEGLADRAAAAGRVFARRFVLLALVTAAVVLAGHPQVPAYALVAAGVYAIARCAAKRTAWCAGAMAIGVALAAFALTPMALLTARSTRALDLDPPRNDVATPLVRLAALVRPWTDGVPAGVRAGAPAFAGYSDDSFFWDTHAYAGVLSVAAAVAAVGWLAAAAAKRRLGDVVRSPAAIVLAMGAIALLLSLAAVRDLLPDLPGTILRSPARLLYLVAFALAAALGAGADRLVRAAAAAPAERPRRRVSLAAAVLLLGLHAADVAWHSRAFVVPRPPFVAAPELERNLLAAVEDGRLGIDAALNLPMNRRVDDLGFFDSILLARPYAALLSLAAAPPTANEQMIDASRVRSRVSVAAGVRLVVTTRSIPNARAAFEENGIRVYGVREPLDRATWFSVGRVVRAEAARTHELLRDASFDLRQTLILPTDAPAAANEVAGESGPLRLQTSRPSPDEIVVRLPSMPEAGWVRVLEAYDRGWSAAMDGRDAAVFPAHEMAMAVPVPAGARELRLKFSTPGATAGRAISLAAVAALAITTLLLSRPGRPVG